MTNCTNPDTSFDLKRATEQIKDALSEDWVTSGGTDECADWRHYCLDGHVVEGIIGRIRHTLSDSEFDQYMDDVIEPILDSFE